MHRDIKPANIMRCEEQHNRGQESTDSGTAAAAKTSTYMLIDFGTVLGVDERIARQTMMTIASNRAMGAGTPPYMSPEMYKVT